MVSRHPDSGAELLIYHTRRFARVTSGSNFAILSSSFGLNELEFNFSIQQEVIKYFTNYPFYFMIFWITNLLAGLISPILLVFKDIRSKHLALISTVADAILLLLTFTFRNRWDVLGSGVAVFDFFILVITFGLYLYCRYVFKKTS